MNFFKYFMFLFPWRFYALNMIKIAHAGRGSLREAENVRKFTTNTLHNVLCMTDKNVQQ